MAPNKKPWVPDIEVEPRILVNPPTIKSRQVPVERRSRHEGQHTYPSSETLRQIGHSPPRGIPEFKPYRDWLEMEDSLRRNYASAEREGIRGERQLFLDKEEEDNKPKKTAKIPPHARQSYFFNPAHQADVFPQSYRMAEINMFYPEEFNKLTSATTPVGVFVYGELTFPHVLRRMLDVNTDPTELAQRMVPGGLLYWQKRCVTDQTYPATIKWDRTVEYRALRRTMTRNEDGHTLIPTSELEHHEKFVGALYKQAFTRGSVILGLTKPQIDHLHTKWGLDFELAEVDVSVATIDKPHRRPPMALQDHSCFPFIHCKRRAAERTTETTEGLNTDQNKYGATSQLQTVKCIMWAWRSDVGEEGLQPPEWKWGAEGWLEGEMIKAYEEGLLDPKSEMYARVRKTVEMKNHLTKSRRS